MTPRRIHTSIRIRTSTVAAFVLASISSAQWNVVYLHPSGATASIGHDVRNGKQVGGVDGVAAVWSGTAASVTYLTPGIAYATDGVEQVGQVGGSQAAVWAGTPGSLVNLHPSAPGLFQSVAVGVHAGLQAGITVHNLASIEFHAALWTGTAASWVDLNPPGCLYSVANDVHNAQQAGEAYLGGQIHAVVWYNSAASIVDLNPPVAEESSCQGVFQGRQAGYVKLNFIGLQRASTWTSTAASWVDLHPDVASESVATAVYFGDLEAGYVVVNGQTRASFWAGTASTWIDLHDFLPPHYTESVAGGIWTSGPGVPHVAGRAFNSITGQYEAILWVRAVPVSASFCHGDGLGTACPCLNNAPANSMTGCLNSLGTGGKLVSTGNASLATDTFALLGSGMPNSSALFFQGTTQHNGGLGSPFGDGLRCAAGAVIRLGTKINANGLSSYPTGLDLSISIKGMIVAPGKRTYQIWYRNAAAFCTASTFNLTNGLTVAWAP